MNRRIMVIDDEESVLNDYALILGPAEGNIPRLEEEEAALVAELTGRAPRPPGTHPEHYEVTKARQGQEGFMAVKEALARGLPFAVVFVDIRMPPGWDGVETAKKIRRIDQEIEIVIVTAYSDRERKEIVREIGMPERLLYLKKPFDTEEIRQLALALTQKWHLERKARRHKQYLERLLLSMSRLKTLTMTSINDLLSAILNEVLFFCEATKGFIARIEEDSVRLELVGEGISMGEAENLLARIGHRLAGVGRIRWIDNVMVLPLRQDMCKLLVLVADVPPTADEEKTKLLDLLLTTSAEVMDNVKKQDQYLKNERIAAIGQLAAGIVHEVNNPLTSLSLAVQVIQRDWEQMWSNLADRIRPWTEGGLLFGGPDRSQGIDPFLETANSRWKIENNFQTVLNGVERVNALMRNIRAFTKTSSTPEMNWGDVGFALEKTLELAHNALKYQIKVHRQWTSPLMAVVNLDELQQVFLNLILNAWQAMAGQGELWITGRSEGGYVRISIKDSGPGLAPDIKDRIFEAFFSTKADGTGLGLSVVKGIVERHGGRIDVESTVGHGATFHIEIPCFPPGSNPMWR